MAHRIFWEKHGIVVTYDGAVSDCEIQQLVAVFQADARYDSVRYILHDFGLCTSLSFAPELMEEISACDGAAAISNPGHRVAIFPQGPELERMVHAYLASGLRPADKVRLFPDAVSARQWASPSPD